MTSRHLAMSTATALLLSGCAPATEETPVAGDTDIEAIDAPADLDTSTEPEPEPDTEPDPEPEPEPEPPYPADWHEQALRVAEESRPAVVAIGWMPPDLQMGRVETGFLVADNLVITSGQVGLAGEEYPLRVRTFDGEIRRATVVYRGREYLGVSLLALDEPVAAPTLRLGDEAELVEGEPLLAIGHPNTASAEGGWLVTAGPFVRTEERALWADLVAPTGGGGFFEGGMSGAPVLDLRGEVVAIVCCKEPWGEGLSIANAEPAEILLRRQMVLDEREWHGGATASVARSTLGQLLPSSP